MHTPNNAKSIGAYAPKADLRNTWKMQPWTPNKFDQMIDGYLVNFINDEFIDQHEGDALSTAKMVLQITNC